MTLSGKDGPVRRALHLWYPWLFVSSLDFARCISWRMMHQSMKMSFLDAVDLSSNARLPLHGHTFCSSSCNLKNPRVHPHPFKLITFLTCSMTKAWVFQFAEGPIMRCKHVQPWKYQVTNQIEQIFTSTSSSPSPLKHCHDLHRLSPWSCFQDTSLLVKDQDVRMI